jgi:hypothetical protein
MSLYYLCVEFMVDFANLIGGSYRDANMMILFGLLPLVLGVDFAFLLCVLFSGKSKKSSL